MGDNRKRDKALLDIDRKSKKHLLEELAHTLLVVRVNRGQDLVCVCTGRGDQLLGGCGHPHSSLTLQGSSFKCLHNEAENSVGFGEDSRVLSISRLASWDET